MLQGDAREMGDQLKAVAGIEFVHKPCPMHIHCARGDAQIAGNFLAPNDFVFDLGQASGGILNCAAFPALQDPNFAAITVQELYLHRGGWDHSFTPDPTYNEAHIMAVSH